MIRQIVLIDEELCDGCGQCVPSCAEGAIRVIDGKARLVSDVLCDGLGACLGHCPQGAIKIERREADAYDEQAVERHLGEGKPVRARHETEHRGPRLHVAEPMPGPHSGGGCPGSRFAQFARQTPAPNGGSDQGGPESPSELTHWPVQLRLLPPNAPVLRGARLLVAADCVPVAYADFHSRMLKGRAVVIACPKLDDTDGYVEKLTEMIRLNRPVEIAVAHMQVPCCTGILHAVLQARQLAGSDVPVEDIVVGVQGQIIAQRRIPAGETASLQSCTD